MIDQSAAPTGTGTLGKALALLDIIATSPEALRFTDLLHHTQQPRASLHRQLTHLVEERLIRLNEDTGTYELGLRLLQWASLTWSRHSLRTVAEPFLRILHERTGETVHLAVLHGHQVVYLDKVESRQAVRMHSQIGNTSPVYCTGVGKAMLATLNHTTAEQLLEAVEFRLFTPNTLNNSATVLQELEQIRQTGYAEDREEHELGIWCVAAAIVSTQGTLKGGVSITAPIFRLQTGQLEQWRQWVAETAHLIGQHLSLKMGPQV